MTRSWMRLGWMSLRYEQLRQAGIIGEKLANS